jgi:hypothetical protein
MAYKFKVYVDYTTREQTPRPFYVGKGTRARLYKLERNTEHSFVSETLGIKRVRVFETNDEQLAYEVEIKFIKDLHTYVDDPCWNNLGCNKHSGGKGGNLYQKGWHHTPETLAHLRGKKRSEETKNRMRLAQLGKRHPGRIGHKQTEETRKKISQGMSGVRNCLGRSLSEEHKQNISKGLKGKAKNQYTYIRPLEALECLDNQTNSF